MPSKLKRLITLVRNHPFLGKKKTLQKELNRFERRLKIYQAKIKNMTRQ